VLDVRTSDNNNHRRITALTTMQPIYGLRFLGAQGPHTGLVQLGLRTFNLTILKLVPFYCSQLVAVSESYVVQQLQ